MPELPEVETVVRGLRRTVLHQIIESVYLEPPKIARRYFEGNLKSLAGSSFVHVQRRGKNILMATDQGMTLWVHLKMTGHFYFYPKRPQLTDMTTLSSTSGTTVIHCGSTITGDSEISG